MLVRKGTYKDFIAQFYGANLVVNIKDQILREGTEKVLS